MVSKKEINIIPGHKSGLPDRHIKAQKHDQYSDEKGHPVAVQILDETKGLIFTFQNGDVCTFHKHDDSSSLNSHQRKQRKKSRLNI